MKTLVGLSGVGGVADYWTLRRGSGSGRGDESEYLYWTVILGKGRRCGVRTG